MTTGKPYLARNVHKGWQIHDPESDEWLTVRMALHITAPLKVTNFVFEDDSEGSVHPNQRVMARRPGTTPKR